MPFWHEAMQHIEEILELMDETIDDAFGMPLTNGKVLIDPEKLRDLINNIRAILPDELKQARLIVSDREDIIRDAKHEAEIIIRSSEDKARAMVADEEVSKQAREKANSIISQAQEKAKQIEDAAAAFSDNILKEVEDIASKGLSEVKQTRQAIRTMRTKQLKR